MSECHLRGESPRIDAYRDGNGEVYCRADGCRHSTTFGDDDG